MEVTMLIPERYKDKIAGVISCYDRMIIQGTLPGWCFDQGMTAFLYSRQIKIFDYPHFAQTLREKVRENAERIAKERGIEIEFIRKIDAFRKEARIKAILKVRGTHPGLVHIFSAMESCTSYKPWHDKKTQKTFLKYDSGKCLHYYFYFIDKTFGLMLSARPYLVSVSTPVLYERPQPAGCQTGQAGDPLHDVGKHLSAHRRL